MVVFTEHLIRVMWDTTPGLGRGAVLRVLRTGHGLPHLRSVHSYAGQLEVRPGAAGGVTGLCRVNPGLKVLGFRA